MARLGLARALQQFDAARRDRRLFARH